MATPPLTRLVRHRLADFPDRASLAQLRSLRVDLAVIHTREYEPETWDRMEMRLQEYPELELEEDLGSARVYRLNCDAPALSPGMSR